MTTARGLHRRLDTAHAEAQARDGGIGDDMEEADARGRGMRNPHDKLPAAPAANEADVVAAVPAHTRDAVFMLAKARGTMDLARASADLAAVAPRDALEARQVALMIAIGDAATEELALASLSRAAGGLRDHRLIALRMADRLTRTVVTLTDAIERRRRPPEQRIVVERVMVADGGRAVVGIVPQGGGGGGDENEHRPHAPAALAHEPGAKMRCADPGREPLPVAGGEGEGPLPDARRGQGQRRAGGAAQRQLAPRPEKPRDHRGAHDRADAAAPGQGRARG
jgi:hypothetical protein